MSVLEIQAELIRLQGELKDRDAELTAIRIMLVGNPGAAANAVREDYPEWATRVDALHAQLAAAQQRIETLREHLTKSLARWKRHVRSDCDPANGSEALQARGRAITRCIEDVEAALAETSAAPTGGTEK